MEILLPVLIGACFGALWAAGEVWVFLLGQKRADAKAAQILREGGDGAKLAAERHRGGYVMKFFVCKYFLDIAMMVVLFLLRGCMPFRWEYMLLSAGVMLAMAVQFVFTKLKPSGDGSLKF